MSNYCISNNFNQTGAAVFLKSSVEDQSGDIEQTESQLDSNSVVDELATEIDARHVTATVYEVRMETRKKIVPFHNCVSELWKLAEYMGTRLSIL